MSRKMVIAIVMGGIFGFFIIGTVIMVINASSP